ncbi:hypothetical protein OBBRIDRAFT_821642 [Obba rivulosa]|uniref:Uncharacterized protein n=1 Tax=Obba rivulosa TaxID=1052685 RepID=A0A8E2AIJ7_9APHY|nr:hypothetical protein OBBRIDRAFT_821642 [Obba rivulosa]
MLDTRIAALITITAIVLLGTVYSVLHDTYLDTSNPLITHLAHPLHATHYFADKKNPLNVYFTKKIWGWTTAGFVFLFATSPLNARTKERVMQYLAATCVFLAFTSWFFGPPVLDRLIANTGGECVLNLPTGAVVPVPNEYCYKNENISPITHPALFATSLLVPDSDWHARPRLRRGHDVSGHIFLLTMSTLFLVDQLKTTFKYSRGNRAAWSPAHNWAIVANIFLVAISLLALYTTSVYFHTPFEKLSGYLLGVAGFAVTQIPALQPAPEAKVVTNKEISQEKEKAHNNKKFH